MKTLAILFSVFITQGDEVQSDELGTILEPDPLVFTFETIGWKISGIVLLIVGIIVLIKQLKLYRKNKYRREAIKKLNMVRVESTSNQQKINHLNVLLKQVAIIAFGRAQVANLYGDEWFSFLDSRHKKIDFAKYANNFHNALYRDEEVDENTLEAITVVTKKWINQHA